MKTTIKISVFLFLLTHLLSCNNEDKLFDKITQIKDIGDSNPTLALSMLDSLNLSIQGHSQEVLFFYLLSKVRLQDKANIYPQSDLVAKRILEFYEPDGTEKEKQEAYFYAGSVYRDLHDTPRALEYFLKSAELAEKNPELDSYMLRNTYSNLFYLYYGVQDYTNAHKYARLEYNLSKETKQTGLTSLMHLGMSLISVDSLEKAKNVYTQALDTVSFSPHLANRSVVLCSLLSEFSYLKDRTHASLCFSILDNSIISNEDNEKCFAYGEYYNLIGEKDSAVYYYQRILKNNTDSFRMYDASKALFHIYKEMGLTSDANFFADEYIRISDSIDLGKRQELAATVNNEFQYHRDRRKEIEIINEKEKFRLFFIISIIAIVAIALFATSFLTYRKNRHLKQLLLLSNELNKHIDNNKKLQEEIHIKEKELKDSESQLKQSKTDLADVKETLYKVNEELALSEGELKKKERLLSERIAQNQTFLNLLHQSELEGSAEDVIYAFRQSSRGTKNMSTADWKQLYRAVDDLYPAFKDKLLKELGTFTEQQMQVCYLMRVGLSKPQIQNMTNLSRVTVWRWVKKYDWVLYPDNEM